MPSSKAKGRKAEAAGGDVRDAIIRVAKTHFARAGLAGASLKAIAAEAGVAGSLINYHFDDKAGLFQAVVNTMTSGRAQAIKRILAEPRSREEVRIRLEMFVEETLVSIIEDPHAYEMVQREMQSGDPAVLKVFKETLFVTFNAAVEFFRHAQSNGFVRPELDPKLLAALLFNSVCESVRNDDLHRHFLGQSLTQPGARKKWSQHVTTLFMNGVIQ